jgi:cephalosporin-C deacetylase
VPLFDLPLDALRTYRPEIHEPPDFDAFWERTLQATRVHPLDLELTRVDHGLETLDAFDVSFSGFAGQQVRGWFLAPRDHAGPLPCVVEYVGYGGGRGFPTDWLTWPSCGFAYLVMDTRGQGSTWRRGDTADPEGSGPQHPGFLTRGILDPFTYYYRRLMADAVRAVEAAAAMEWVDAERIAVTGRSQGGGLAIAAAALSERVKVAMPDVPFLCAFRRATEVTDASPYAEVAAYCRVHRDREETAFATLAYFDGVSFASRGTADALFSVALMDQICPPSTVYAAYNRWGGAKQIRVYPYNGHEGGDAYQTREQIAYLRELWK